MLVSVTSMLVSTLGAMSSRIRRIGRDAHIVADKDLIHAGLQLLSRTKRTTRNLLFR